MEELERNIALLTLLANKTLEGSTKTALLFAIEMMRGNLARMELNEAMKAELGIESISDADFIEQLRARYPKD